MFNVPPQAVGARCTGFFLDDFDFDFGHLQLPEMVEESKRATTLAPFAQVGKYCKQTDALRL
jgi:hypothetical protein